VSREQRFPFWEGTATILFGWAVAMGGDFKRGRRTMQTWMQMFSDTGARVQQTSWLGMFAEIHHHAKRYEEGMALVDDAMSFVGTTGERYYLSELYRLKGDLLIGLGGSDRAEDAAEAYRRTISVAQEQSATTRELRATLSLALLLRDEGHLGDARAILQARRSLFEGDTNSGVDVENARELIATF
jgi:adenylate cyclase